MSAGQVTAAVLLLTLETPNDCKIKGIHKCLSSQEQMFLGAEIYPVKTYTFCSCILQKVLGPLRKFCLKNTGKLLKSSPAQLIVQVQRALGFQNTCKILAKLKHDGPIFYKYLFFPPKGYFSVNILCVSLTRDIFVNKNACI